MFQCTVCGSILEPRKCKYERNEELCELYIICPYCGGECADYEETEKEDN